MVAHHIRGGAARQRSSDVRQARPVPVCDDTVSEARSAHVQFAARVRVLLTVTIVALSVTLA